MCVLYMYCHLFNLYYFSTYSGRASPGHSVCGEEGNKIIEKSELEGWGGGAGLPVWMIGKDWSAGWVRSWHSILNSVGLHEGFWGRERHDPTYIQPSESSLGPSTLSTFHQPRKLKCSLDPAWGLQRTQSLLPPSPLAATLLVFPALVHLSRSSLPTSLSQNSSLSLVVPSSFLCLTPTFSSLSCTASWSVRSPELYVFLLCPLVQNHTANTH